MKGTNKKRQRMTDEEKRKKFGDKYDPNFGKGQKKTDNKDDYPTENDYRFYAVDEQIAKDVGSISYNVLAGQALDLGIEQVIEEGSVKTKVKTTVNNVMVIKTIDAQLSTGDASEGITTAQTQLYGFVRHVNSGAKVYEPSDLMMYVLGMRSVYNSAFKVRRLIGIANYYNVLNRNVPERLSAALGVNFADLQANIAKYRGEFNILCKRINSLAVPKYFKAFERGAYIYNNVFTDSDSITGQFYVFDREGYFLFSTTTSEEGTELIYTPYNTGTLSLEYYLQTLRDQINAIKDDTDAATMTGDILHAFKDGELYGVSGVTEDYVVAPTMDEDILAQIENMVVADSWGFETATRSGMNVTQSNGKIIWTPSWTVNTIVYNYTNKVFNSHKANPDYKDNLEWSRLITVIDAEATAPTTTKVTLKSCGLELCAGMVMYKGEENATGLRTSNLLPMTSTTVSRSTLSAMMTLQQFDWHPAILLILASGSGTVSSVEVAMDLKRYTMLADSTIINIHNEANLAAFYADDLYNLRRTYGTSASSK